MTAAMRKTVSCEGMPYWGLSHTSTKPIGMEDGRWRGEADARRQRGIWRQQEKVIDSGERAGDLTFTILPDSLVWTAMPGVVRLQLFDCLDFGRACDRVVIKPFRTQETDGRRSSYSVRTMHAENSEVPSVASVAVAVMN